MPLAFLLRALPAWGGLRIEQRGPSSCSWAQGPSSGHLGSWAQPVSIVRPPLELGFWGLTLTVTWARGGQAPGTERPFSPQLLRVEQRGPLRAGAAPHQDGGRGVLVSSWPLLGPCTHCPHPRSHACCIPGGPGRGPGLTSAPRPPGCHSETSCASSPAWRSAT